MYQIRGGARGFGQSLDEKRGASSVCMNRWGSPQGLREGGRRGRFWGQSYPRGSISISQVLSEAGIRAGLRMHTVRALLIDGWPLAAPADRAGGKVGEWEEAEAGRLRGGEETGGGMMPLRPPPANPPLPTCTSPLPHLRIPGGGDVSHCLEELSLAALHCPGLLHRVAQRLEHQLLQGRWHRLWGEGGRVSLRACLRLKIVCMRACV
jgi:hypothetical protein